MLSKGWGLLKQVALELFATFSVQERVLGFGLNAFGHDAHAERASQTNDRANDGEAVITVVEVTDEALVDLNFVEWEATQIAERRVASAEIVHRDMGAERLDLVQNEHD